MFDITQGSPPVQPNRNGKYNFGQLLPGTFVTVPAGHEMAEINASGAPRISSCAYSFGKRRGWKIEIHRMSNKEVRVYRTK